VTALRKFLPRVPKPTATPDGKAALSRVAPHRSLLVGVDEHAEREGTRSMQGRVRVPAWALTLVIAAGCAGDDDGDTNPMDVSSDRDAVADARLRDVDGSTTGADRGVDMSSDTANPMPDATQRDALNEDRDAIEDIARTDVDADMSIEASDDDADASIEINVDIDGDADASVDADATEIDTGTTDAPTDTGGICGAGSGTPALLGTISMFRAVSDASNIYFITQNQLRIQAIPKNGGSPSTIVDTVATIADLAVDATDVYFTASTGVVYRCALSGCGNAPSVIASLQVNPDRIVQSSNAVFYTTDDKIMSCPVGGCGSAAVVFGDAGSTLSELATNGTNLYWTRFTSDGGSSADIVSCPLTGCAGAPTVIAANQQQPFALTTDGNVVAWISSEGEGALKVCQVGGCGGAPRRLASAFGGGLSGLLVHSGQIYWADQVRLYRCATAGCDSMPSQYSLGLIPDFPFTVASDDTGIYWWERGTGTLKKCPPCGCSGTVTNAVERSADRATDVVTDGSNVFWIDKTSRLGLGYIYTCAAASCANTATVMAAGNALNGLLRHGSYLYFFEGGYDTGSSILRRWPPYLSPAVTIIGTLTGLPVGTSITLQLNGGGDLTRTADGLFTFPTTLSADSSFNVTILTQPMGRTCRVSGGSGTAGATDVSVVINCALGMSTIGGTVSGFGSGPGLAREVITLQNNGSDAITVSGDGTFAFPTLLAPNTPYNIAVSAWQAVSDPCTVAAGSGTTSSTASDVTNVAINCTRRYAGPRAGGLTTDGQHLYWIQGGTLAGSSYVNGAAVRVPITGGAVEMLASGLANVSVGSTAIDADYLYFSAFAQGTINRVPRAGGAVQLLAVGQPSPTSLTINGTTLYWASATHIMSLDLAADAGVPVPVAASPAAGVFGADAPNISSPRRLIVGTGLLYWVTPAGSYDEQVERSGLRGQNRVSLAFQQAALGGGIALAGGKVFFTGTRPALMSVAQ